MGGLLFNGSQSKGLITMESSLLQKKAGKRFLRVAEKVFYQTGKMLEKYNIETCSFDVSRGEYDLQEGFGWTNGVILGLMDLLK
jgi:alpha,alpha-trehalase